MSLNTKDYHLKQLGLVSDTMTKIEETMFAHVLRARKSGATWQEIGDSLGVTRQAAHTRWHKKVEQHGKKI